MYIDSNTIISASAVLGAAVAILGALFAVYRWYLKQNKQDTDIAEIREELCMHTYVLLAVLDGLKQKGCNGKVTEAQEKLSKHINKQAHDVGRKEGP